MALEVGETKEPFGGGSLVARIANGDYDAEAQLMASYQRTVLILVRRHCRPLEAAVEDLAQDVMLTLLKNLRAGALRDEGALQAYVRQTIVWTVQAEYRKRARHGKTVDEEVLDLEPDGGNERADSAQPPLVLQRLQSARRVHRLLAELNVARDREILRRHFLLEEDRDTICDALGIDEAHFRRVLFRARSRFAALAREAGLEDTW